MDNKERYHLYLQSEAWQKKRTERLKIDNFTCQRCGSKRGLQVHHLNYKNLGNENIYCDLITLCEECHRNVEMNSKNHSNKAHNRLIKDFIQECENEKKDLSVGGELNLCDLKVIKPILFEYLRARGDYSDSGSNLVQQYFRNRKYEQILRYIDGGFPIYICIQRTGFSDAMVKKVYNNPEQARKFLKEEEENAET